MSLNPIFIIQKNHDLYSVAAIGPDATTPDERPSLHVRGEPGKLLYMALTGHRFGTSPDTAHQLIATQARAALTAYNSKSIPEVLEYLAATIGPAPDLTEILNQAQQYLLARAVVADWGNFIKPFLGYFYLNKQRQIITHHQDYEKVILLPEPQTWGQFNLMSN